MTKNWKGFSKYQRNAEQEGNLRVHLGMTPRLERAKGWDGGREQESCKSHACSSSSAFAPGGSDRLVRVMLCSSSAFACFCFMKMTKSNFV